MKTIARLGLRTLAASGFLLLCSSWASAGIYLELTGPSSGSPTIEGESAQADHNKWIEIQSVSMGNARQGYSFAGASTASAGKASFADISLQKEIDKSSPQLMFAVAKGSTYQDAHIDFVQEGSSPFRYMRYELKDVLVTSYSQSAEADSGPPADTFTITFTAIRINYYRFPDTNPTSTGEWNVKLNSGSANATPDTPFPPGAKPIATGVRVRIDPDDAKSLTPEERKLPPAQVEEPEAAQPVTEPEAEESTTP